MISLKDVKSILIIGAGGGLAKLTASLIAQKYPEISIHGVDPRDTDFLVKKENIKYQRMKYNRGNFERLFREKSFDMVLHLGRLSHAQSDQASLSKRLDLNLMGTSKILELCLKQQVKKVLIMSTYHVYGALHDNPVFIPEDYPLKASIKYPELRDVVEMDQIATNWMWKNQNQIETIVLRPCSIIGPQIKNTMSQYLTTPYVPVPIDFNPMFQFIHEFDMAKVIIKCLDRVPTGIFNVAPDEVISLRDAKDHLGVPYLPAPIFILEQAAKIVKMAWNFPDYFINYIKYSCIIDNSELKKHIGESFCRFGPKETLELLKLD